MKCLAELIEFDISYKPQAAIKAQALANFVVELTKPNPKASGDQAVTRSSRDRVWRVWLVTVDSSSSEERVRARVILESLDRE